MQRAGGGYERDRPPFPFLPERDEEMRAVFRRMRV